MKRPVFILFFSSLLAGVCGYILNIPLIFFTPILILFLFLNSEMKRYAIFATIVFLLVFIRGESIRNKESLFDDGENFEKIFLINEKKTVGEYNTKYIISFDKNIKAMLSVPNENAIFKIGDIVEGRIETKRPDMNQNDGLFSYGEYLKRNQINNYFISRGELNIKGVSDDFFIKSRRVFYEKMEEANFRLFNERNAKLFLSIWTGEDYGEMKLHYRDIGISHLFSISGLHIALLYGLIQKVLAPVVHKKYLRIFGLILIFFYIGIIGFPISAMRAFLMIAVITLSRTFAYGHDDLTSLLFTTVILLILNPANIKDPGFYLSIVGTWAVIRLLPILKRRGIKSPIIQSLAIWLSLAPLVLYFFDEIPLIGILANIILIPIFSIMVNIAFITALIYFLLPFVALNLAFVANSLADIFFLIVDYLFEFSFLMIIWKINIIEMLWYYMLVFLYIHPINWHVLSKTYQEGIIWTFVFTIFLIFIFPYQKEEIKVIDIGQGDAILIQNKGINFMIDVGGEIREEDWDTYENILKKVLARERIYDLEAVFISHFDKDHIENLDALAEDIKIKNIVVAKYIYEDEDIINFTNIIQAKTGDKFFFSDISAEVIYDGKYKNNNDSLILLLEKENNSIIFMGDLEKETEERINFPEADIIKIGHHGSKTSTTNKILDEIQPSIAIISAGYRNMHNHPHDEVIERLEERDISIYRTDEIGNIKIRLDGDIDISIYPGFLNLYFLISIIIFPILIYILLIYERRYCAKTYIPTKLGR